MATAPTTILKDWKKINLEKECSFERGMEPGAGAYNTEGIGDRFIRVVDVTESRDNLVFVNDIHTTKRVKKNDILLTLDGTVGAVIRGLEGIYSTGVRKVSFRDAKNSDRLLYYLLQSTDVQRTIDSYASGSIIKHASAAISHLITAIPENLKEQNKIADVLELVDEAINKTDELIKKYERIRTGMMQDLFRYGIDEKGQIRSEKTHKFKNSPLGRIPEEWDVVMLAKTTAKITKGESPNWQGFEYQEDGILFVTSENVRDGYLDNEVSKYVPSAFHSKLKRSQLKRGDLLVNLVGASIARSALFYTDSEANINQAVALVRFDTASIPEFYLNYLQIRKNISRLLDEQVETARANLSLANIREFLVPRPSIAEQGRITKALLQITGLMQVEKNQFMKLTSIKSGVMGDLLTGTVRTDHLIEK